MRIVDGRPIYSASDLTGFLACEHLLQLERAAARGDRERPDREDPDIEVIAKRGLQHERSYLESLRIEGRKVVEIGADQEQLRTMPIAALEDLQRRTVDAMREGAPVVYQGVFFDGRWQGYADFLLRVERPSPAFGAHSYEVADTKLARHVKAGALLQTCVYSDLLAEVQGSEPERIHVVLGDRTTASYRYADYAAYYRSVRGRFEAAVASGEVPTYPDPVEHCEVCRWLEICDRKRRDDDHLSLVAGLSRAQTKKLATADITTLAALASSTVPTVRGIGDPTLVRLRRQARLQQAQRTARTPSYELLDPEPERGFARLPEPSAGDLFFDMEGDPLVEDGGLEYLFGVAWTEDGEERFRAFWAHDREQEKRAFEEFMDFVGERRAIHPDLHIFHYADYEASTLRRLMGRHASREAELDDLLRGRVLVDLYRVVRESIAISQESYSLKKVEAFYMPPRTSGITEAGSSIVAYERYIDSRDPAILTAIHDYNRDDCLSTLRLRDWLEERRNEASRTFETLIARAAPDAHTDGADEAIEELSRTDALVRRLTDGLPADGSERDETQQATWLLAQLLGWHRREDKSGWWAYYARFEMTDEELLDESEAIAGLELVESRPEKRSVARTYRFPVQDYRLKEGEDVCDPARKASAGTILELDGARRLVTLKSNAAVPEPRAIVAGGPIGTREQRSALFRLGEWVAENGIASSEPRYRAVRDLILGRPPRRRGIGPLVRADEHVPDAARRLALELDGGCLSIQGPPGSGKTRTASEMAVDLALAGMKVGVVANSHKVIGNLLLAILKAADRRNATIEVAQKADGEDRADDDRIISIDSKDVAPGFAEGRFQVVGATAWTWARADLFEKVDVLFVDEAGQFSLANVAAVAQCARDLVLLGDPNQLAQPGNGVHPPGAGASGLGHVLAGATTMPDDRGLFLPITYRMRPEITAFVSQSFYEGKLRSDPVCATRSLDGAPPAGGTGLRLIEVPHEGERMRSVEEAQRVRDLVAELRTRTWTDHDGATRRIGLEDIVIVAPYNAQVGLLRETLPAGARVGTVDKFQGQEAPISIYSMGSSSVEEAPRGMSFLFELNRLNVAMSRAQVLAIVVLSPALLRPSCRTPEQMRQANALCLLAELAVRA